MGSGADNGVRPTWLRLCCSVLIRGFKCLALLATGVCWLKTGSPDPAFPTIPFDHWLTEQDQAHFQWTAKVIGGRLTNLQRLGATVDVEVDGNELANRRGRGELAIFIQFSDADHRVYQTHGAIQLKDATEEAAKSNFIYNQTAVVAPGDYRVDVAMLDTNTGEHATLTRTLHVAPLQNDPLPDSMRGLPLVEFTPAGDPPDIWYQPELTGKLHLPLEMRRPLRVEVLANASPSSIGPRFRTGELNSRILADLLPGLKVISQIELSQGDMNVSLIDLTRRQVLFTQPHVDPKAIRWIGPSSGPLSCKPTPTRSMCARLSDSRRNPQFFVEEVRRRIQTEGALIILSGPIAFARSDDRRPIELETSRLKEESSISATILCRCAGTSRNIPVRSAGVVACLNPIGTSGAGTPRLAGQFAESPCSPTSTTSTALINSAKHWPR